MLNQNTIYHCLNGLKDIEEIEKTPLEERISLNSTYEILEQAADLFGDKKALIFLPEGNCVEQPITFSYYELLQKVNQTANVMTENFNISKDDAVSYLLPNLPENYFILWAAEAVAIANPISPLLEPEQMARILKISQSKLFITLCPKDDPFWPSIIKARQLLKEESGIEIKLLVLRGDGDEEQAIYSYENLVAKQPHTHLINKRTIKKEEVCAYFHSSGTTALPKLTMLTHWNKLYMAWAASEFFDYKRDDVILSGMPMFHVAAPTIAGNAAFLKGAAIVIMSPTGWLNPNVIINFWDLVNKYKGTHTAAINFIYTALLKQPKKDHEANTLRIAFSGAALMPDELEEFEKLSGSKVIEIYGSTETTCFATFNPPKGPSRFTGSMGIRFPYEQIRVVKMDNKNNYVRDCEMGEEGWLWIKGPNVATYKQEALNQNRFLEPDWLNMQDIVRQEREGFYRILCRASDLIYRNDEIIFALFIEQIFLTHPKIKTVAVLGQPDEKEHEIPMAMIQLHEGQECTSEELKNWLKEKLEKPSHLPYKIIICNELPINGMGKVQKTILQYELIKNTIQDRLCEVLKENDCNFNIKVGHDETAKIIITIHIFSAEENIIATIKENLNKFNLNFNIVQQEKNEIIKNSLYA